MGSGLIGLVLFALVVVFSVVVAAYADRKGYPSVPAFLLCFVISPLAVLLLIALLPEREQPEGRGRVTLAVGPLPDEIPFDMLVQIEQERAKHAERGA